MLLSNGVLLEYFTISRNDSVYECFPDVVSLNDGTLVCVYRESQGHVPGNFTRIVTRSSTDGGSTWTRRKIISETRGSVNKTAGWNCPRISQVMGDRFVLACDLTKWPESERTTREFEVYLWWSNDGQNWQGPEPTGVQGIVPDKVRDLPDGTLALGTHDLSPYTGNLRQLLWTSSDGKNWCQPTIVAADPDLNLCEGSLLNHEGSLLFIMRENSGLGRPGYKAILKPELGEWEKPETLPLPGCHRPVAEWWKEKVLVTYRCYIGQGMKNTLVLGAIMDPGMLFDGLEDGAGGRIFPIDYDRSTSPDTGYTGWCIREDDSILIVNYIVDDAPKAQIRGYILAKDEIISL